MSSSKAACVADHWCRLPRLFGVTAPWPPPSGRPVTRVGSPGLAVAVSIVAMLTSLAIVLMGLVGLRSWVIESGTGTPTLPPVTTSPSMSPMPAPEQTVGPVTVTDSIKRGVVLISGRTPGDSVAGTGMVLTADGLVLTNYHVVRSTQAITVTVASTGRRYEATLIGRDATVDVALLKLTAASGLETVSIDPDSVSIGQVVIAAGNANGQGYVTANRGNVLGLGRSIRVTGPVPDDPPETLRGLIETNAPAWPGDSGGPMFDESHEVLGVITAGSSDDERETRHVYAIPIADALKVVDKIQAGDESGSVVIGPKAYMGILAKSDDSGGVIVTGVESSTPAARVGIRENDRILTLAGRDVTNRLELSHILDDIEPGETVEVTWSTDGRLKSGRITLGKSPLN